MDSISAIVSPSSWTSTIPIESFFAVKAPVEVDVGCGKGRFLLARASSHPQTNFLGIDRLLVRLRKIDKRALKAGLQNVRLLRIEASYAMQFLLPPLSVRTFYVFFPDPWPKRRHHGRRLFNRTFIDNLHDKLLAGGLVHAATDHIEYFDEICALFRADPRFEEIPPFHPTEDERTDFELMFTSEHAKPGRCSFRKRPS